MRRYMLPALVAGAIGLSGAAFAATMTDGTIKSMDLAKHQITLDNGITYTLPAGFKDPGLKVGAKVAVDWNMVGQNHEASSVTLKQ